MGRLPQVEVPEDLLDKKNCILLIKRKERCFDAGPSCRFLTARFRSQRGTLDLVSIFNMTDSVTFRKTVHLLIYYF